MCLRNNDPTKVSILLKKKRINCYKVFNVYNLALKSLSFKMFYKSGWNCSNSLVKRPILKRIELKRGIYVFLNEKLAECFYQYNDLDKAVIVPVTAFTSDLIGASGEIAVFSKIYISEKNYEKAVNE